MKVMSYGGRLPHDPLLTISVFMTLQATGVADDDRATNIAGTAMPTSI